MSSEPDHILRLMVIAIAWEVIFGLSVFAVGFWFVAMFLTIIEFVGSKK